MSRENLELVRAMYEAYLNGDVERALAYTDVDQALAAARTSD
jgi:hypothetical protein